MPEAFLTITLVFDILQDYIDKVAHSCVKNDSYMLNIFTDYICNSWVVSKVICASTIVKELLTPRLQVPFLKTPGKIMVG